MKPTFQLLSEKGYNINFLMTSDGFIGLFRIHYEDKSRKNSSFENVIALQIYFEGLPEGDHYFNSYRTENVTDAMLFCERKKQWILEDLVRQRKAIMKI